MRKLWCFVALSIPTLAEAQQPKRFEFVAGVHETGKVKGELKHVHGVPVLVLRGSPKEMGEQAGVLAVRQVKPLFRYPHDYFLKETTGTILRENPKWDVQGKPFKEALADAEKALWPLVQAKAAGLGKNFPEPYRIELNALADAVGKDVVSRDVLVSSNGLFDLGHVTPGQLLFGCSSLIVPAELSATKGLLFGRNMDFHHFGYLHRYSLLTVYVSDDPKAKHSFASAGFPGLVGCFTGMNDAGLTVASHEVQDPDTTTRFNPKGVPFAMTYRRVLEECATVNEALALLDRMERASVTSLVIADPTGGAVIEVTPDTLAIRRFKDKPGVCTNHFCTMKNPKLKEEYDTLKRFDGLTASVATAKAGGFGVRDVQERMHAAKLVADGEELTIHTFVFEPAKRTVHLRFSSDKEPATTGELKTLDLRDLWGK